MMGPIENHYHYPKSFLTCHFLLFAVVIFLSLTSTPSVVEASTLTLQGCFVSPGSNVFFNHRHVYQSIGNCLRACSDLEYDGSDTAGSQVMALTNATACLCGEPGTVPPVEDEIPPDQCNLRCTGFPMETCGGKGYFQVYTIDEDKEPECDVFADQ